jgi:hypothetical protein
MVELVSPVLHLYPVETPPEVVTVSVTGVFGHTESGCAINAERGFIKLIVTVVESLHVPNVA